MGECSGKDMAVEKIEGNEKVAEKLDEEEQEGGGGREEGVRM